MSEPVLLTLIHKDGLPADAAAAAQAALAAAGAAVTATIALDPPCATDLVVRGITPAAVRAAVEPAVACDVVAQPVGPRRMKRLLVADMDSTMIGQECIDELADFAGLKAEIAAITEAAMRGDLDFAQALDARVAALEGLATDAIDACLAERIQPTPGAATLIATLRAHGGRTVLVSGGFTVFTEVIAARLGFDRQVANLLHLAGGRLAGTVGRPIVDSATKKAVLIAERDAMGLAPSDTLALGDGANDIPMLEEAGLGIAYHGKPKAAAAADAAIRHGDLTAVLWALGLPRAEWVAAS